MKSFHVCIIALVSLPFAAPNANALRNKSVRERPVMNKRYGILGGKPTSIERYSHMVSFTYTPDNFLIGAGSILNKNWILCSAYEIKGYPLQDITIRAGSRRAGSGGQLLNVSKIIIYDKFYGGYPDDFAVIKTESPIKLGRRAKPIKLAKVTPKVGTNVQVVGFGLSSIQNQSRYELHVATVKVKSKEECIKQHGDLGDTCLCADADGVGPCYADMGAALIYKRQLLGYYLGGDGCNYYNILEIYAHVVPVRQWILDTIRDNCSQCEPKTLSDEFCKINNDNSNVVQKDEKKEDGSDSDDDRDDDGSNDGEFVK